MTRQDIASDPSTAPATPPTAAGRAARLRGRIGAPRPTFGDGVTPRPLLRGWLHLACFVLSVPAGVVLVVSATSTAARVGSVIYALGLALVFGVSALYHRVNWSPAARARMRRLDHGTIFVMIAGSFTPLAMVLLDGASGAIMLGAAWTGAAAGLGLAFAGVAQKPIGTVSYIAFGWLLMLALPELARQLTGTELALLTAGGVTYTVGYLCFVTRWPDPHPLVFGYHELWHVLVVAAVVCHYLTIASVVRGA